MRCPRKGFVCPHGRLWAPRLAHARMYLGLPGGKGIVSEKFPVDPFWHPSSPPPVDLHLLGGKASWIPQVPQLTG